MESRKQLSDTILKESILSATMPVQTRSMTMKCTLRCDGCTMTKPEHLFHFVDDWKFCDECDYEPTNSECESQCECINGFTCDYCDCLEAVDDAEQALRDAEHELNDYLDSLRCDGCAMPFKDDTSDHLTLKAVVDGQTLCYRCIIKIRTH